MGGGEERTKNSGPIDGSKRTRWKKKLKIIIVIIILIIYFILQ